MANGLYAIFKQRLLDKALDLDTDVIKAVLADSADYTVNLTTHDDLADVAGAAIVATSSALTSPTIALGVFDTADFTWSTVTGDVCEIVLLYDDTHASDALIVYYDASMTGMPVTPNGGNINFTVHASGFFAL